MLKSCKDSTGQQNYLAGRWYKTRAIAFPLFMADEEDDDATRVHDEVEALRAIYCADNVSFGGGSVSVTLRTNAQLSVTLPTGYPSRSRPGIPTLRARGLDAARSAHVVDSALSSAHETVAVGEESLFEYASAVLIALDAALAESPSAPEVPTLPEALDSETAQVRLASGEPVVDRKSVFIGQAARVHGADAAALVIEAVRTTHTDATHCSWAYVTSAASGTPDADCDDDGEKGAGRAMLRTLQQRRVADVVVVVSRWFGGTKLGPVRFRHICAATRSAVDALENEESAPS